MTVSVLPRRQAIDLRLIFQVQGTHFCSISDYCWFYATIDKIMSFFVPVGIDFPSVVFSLFETRGERSFYIQYVERMFVYMF